MSRRLSERHLNKLKAAANAIGWTLVISKDLEGGIIGSHAFCLAVTERMREAPLVAPAKEEASPAAKAAAAFKLQLAPATASDKPPDPNRNQS
jgi:hypothetical protein